MGIYLIRFFCQFNEKPITSQDPHSQIKNYKMLGAQYLNENDSEVTETNKTSAILNFVPKILPDDKIDGSINPLNLKQSLQWGPYMG